MAVGAIFVAGLFVVLLLFFGYSAAFKDKKPLVMPVLLVLAGMGVVLSFAGRRMIRNSEGTRTGENLTSSAWWICMVGGLGYFAYLSGIEYSIKSDAQAEVERWVDDVLKGNDNAAFFRTMEAAARSQYTPDNIAPLKARFPDRDVWFRQVDLVRIAKRNQGACEFKLGGMREWVTRPDMINCVFTGVLKCPEGTFPVEIALRGTESAPGADASVRQWEIVGNPTGFVQNRQVAMTPYGWRLAELEQSGGDVGRAFIAAFQQGPIMAPWVYQTLIHPDPRVEFWLGLNALAQYPFWGPVQRQLVPILTDAIRTPMVALALAPEYLAYPWEKFLRMPGGSSHPDDRLKVFLSVWKASSIFPPGRGKGGLLPNNDVVDGSLLINVTDKAVEVRVPCEIPEPGGERAYRARVVVACDDRAVLDDLARLRSEADPDRGTVPQPSDFRSRAYKWRVVALESDLVAISTNAMPQPDQMNMPMPGR
jgi:hypothetical protein